MSRWTCLVLIGSLLGAGACADDSAEAPEVTTGSASDPSSRTRRTLTTAWTDQGLFMYRLLGDEHSEWRDDEAAIVDPATGEELAATEPLFEAPLTFGMDLTAVDDEVVAIGVECAAFVPEEGEEHDVCVPGTISAAAYGLTEQAWRAIDLPEGIASLGRDDIVAVHGVTADGRLVVEADAGLSDPGAQRFWTYSASADEWEAVRAFDGAVEGVCVAGDELVVSTSTESPPNRIGEEHVDARLHSLALDDPSADWVTGEPLPEARFMWGPGLACTDTFAVAFGYEAFSPRNTNQLRPMAHRHDLGDVASGGWDEVQGLRRDIVVHGALRVDDEVLLLAQGLAMVVGRSGPAELVDVPSAPPDIGPVWTGEELVFVDVRRDDEVSTARLP